MGRGRLGKAGRNLSKPSTAILGRNWAEAGFRPVDRNRGHQAVHTESEAAEDWAERPVVGIKSEMD